MGVFFQQGLKMMVAENDGVFLFEAKPSEHVFLAKRFPCFFVNTWFLNPNTTTPSTSNRLVFPRETSKSKSWKVNCETLAEASFKRRGGWEASTLTETNSNSTCQVATIRKRKRESLPISSIFRCFGCYIVSGRN